MDTIETNEKAALNVFISAGTSMLGRAVVRACAAAGHKVTAMTTNRAGAEIVRADGGTPVYAEAQHSGEIRSMMKMAKTDVAVHLGSQVANEVPFLGVVIRPDALVEESVAFAKAATDAGVKFFVHTSFTTLYKDAHGEQVDETAALTQSGHPLLVAGKNAEKAALDCDVPASVLRAGYVYGADSTVLSELQATIKVGRKSIPVGRGDNVANWIHADDFAAALLLVIEQQPAGEIFNIVDDAPVTPGQFLAEFATTQGLPVPNAPGVFGNWRTGKWANDLLALSVKADNRKAKDQLGWTLKYANYDVGIDQVLLMWRAAMSVSA